MRERLTKRPIDGLQAKETEFAVYDEARPRLCTRVGLLPKGQNVARIPAK